MSEDNCAKCGKDTEVLYFMKKEDEWWCDECFTSAGNKLLCHSCEEGVHELN